MATGGNTSTNVTAGKPKVTGAIHVAPLGTTLPTSTDDELTGFKGLGYCSEDGLVNGTNLETTDIKAWGGDTVLDITTEKPDTFKLAFLEYLPCIG